MRSYRAILLALIAALLLQPRAAAQAEATSDDPLTHGHALLIGNSHYSNWPQLLDVPLQLKALRDGLKSHFDTVDLSEDLTADQLRDTITQFLRNYGNDPTARLFIYYAGHGYSEPLLQYSEYRGYITGIDTPSVDRSYDEARPHAMSMEEVRSPLSSALAKHILFVFDSCFAGTIFLTRTDERPPKWALENGILTPNEVARIMSQPSRDIITAGDANQLVPAHSPIPDLLLAAIGGGADRYNHGVVSAAEIKLYLADEVRKLPAVKLSPLEGRLQDQRFAQGDFLFRIIQSAAPVLVDHQQDASDFSKGPHATAFLLNNVLAHAKCELRDVLTHISFSDKASAARYKRRTLQWLESMSGTISIKLFVDEQGRTEVVDYPFVVKRDFLTQAGIAPCIAAEGDSDLGISDWLDSVTLPFLISASVSKDVTLSPPNRLSHEVGFVTTRGKVVQAYAGSGGRAGPLWTVGRANTGYLTISLTSVHQ
jgi:hypothetical protein